MPRRLRATWGKPHGKDDEIPPNAAWRLVEIRERKAWDNLLLLGGREFNLQSFTLTPCLKGHIYFYLRLKVMSILTERPLGHFRFVICEWRFAIEPLTHWIIGRLGNRAILS
jgi:hypothetical protein